MEGRQKMVKREGKESQDKLKVRRDKAEETFSSVSV